MPPPLAVKLKPHDHRWLDSAELEGRRLLRASPTLREIHHIGSTAIEGIVAKPIIDLLGVAQNLSDLDEDRSLLEALGYVWHGEYGLTGRRYYTLSGRQSGERLVQLHCYARGDASIMRHLAFRDYLRAYPEVASAYEGES
jgi:GrpB-like predicted nucleotidyltransferase (UPF0157 family)